MIGDMEQRYQHMGRIVCPECMSRFAAAPQAPGMAYPMPYAYSGVVQDQSGKATASLVLGCVGLLAWILPIIGLPVTIIGVVMGSKGLKSSSRGMAIAGIVLSSIGLLLSLANAAWGAYLGATGQLQF